jgi:hypothetical protein
MSRKIKESRGQRESRKYAIVMNATGDAKLAQRARGWSDTHIREAVGVKTPRKANLKPYDVKRVKRKQREYSKYVYGIQQGLSVEEAIKLKSYKKAKIEATKKYYNEKRLPAGIFEKSKEYRIKLWQEWAKENKLPPEIHRIALEINRELSDKNRIMEDSDKYGYAVAFYMFTEGESAEDVMNNRIKIDRYDGNRYIEMMRIA